MSIGPDIIPTPAPPPGSFRPDDADAWNERKLAILSELAEAGLEIALALKTRIVETAAVEPDPASAVEYADLTRAFDRASRAVRLSIALRDKLLKDAAAVPARPDPAHETRAGRAERVRRIVRRVVKTEFKSGPLCEALDRHVAERLYDTDITGDLSNRSIGELVAQICADLGLMPRWRDFAEEAWAQAEITERPPGSPYAAWPDLPPDEPDPEDSDPWDPGLWDSDDAPEDDGEEDDPGGGDP
jgi:hypothetical protein